MSEPTTNMAGEPADAGAFDAFISYAHADSKVAGRLQRLLQRYPLPGEERRLRVFLDQTDIRSGDLTDELDAALRGSQALVVCCSPASTESEWVGREISRFLDTADRPVVPIVLHGDPDDVIPRSLRTQEHRFLDLRDCWRLGILGPGGRIELARGIATITGRPLRDLIDWEKRRQRALAVRAGIASLLLAAAVLFYPLDYQRELAIPDLVGALRTFEFSEVRDDRLLATAREIAVGPQGGRNYVAFYPDVLADGEWNWLDSDTFSPRTRLVREGLLERGAWETLQSLDLGGLRAAAEELAAEREIEAEYFEPGAGLDPRGPWVGEPAPGLFVIMYVVPPIPADPVDLMEGYITAPAGDALVAVAAPGVEPRIARVDGLDPQDVRRIGPRSVDISREVPIAASGDELWIGMATRDSDGRGGGLWHSANGGRAWRRVENFDSVASIAIDPTDPERVLVAVAPGRLKTGVRERTLPAQLLVRNGARAAWHPLQPAPPFGSDSRIQLAGFFRDGALAVQVDASIFELGRDNLARRLFGSYRRVAPPSE